MVRSSSMTFSCTATTRASQERRYGSSRNSSSAKEGDHGDAEYHEAARGEEAERGLRDVGHVGVGRDRLRVVVVAVLVVLFRLREARVEVLEEVVGDLLRRRVHQARADLRQLAADAGLDVIGKPCRMAFG